MRRDNLRIVTPFISVHTAVKYCLHKHKENIRFPLLAHTVAVVVSSCSCPMAGIAVIDMAGFCMGLAIRLRRCRRVDDDHEGL